MKILYVGDLSSYARARQRFLAMQDLEYSVKGISSVPSEKELDLTDRPRLWERFRWKVGYPVDLVGVNQKMLEEAELYQPDLIWIDKGLMIHKSTLHSLRNILPNLKLALWLPEYINPKQNRSVYFLQCLPLYDYIFSPMSQNCRSSWVSRKGIRSLNCVNQGYDKYLHYPVKVGKNEQNKFGSDVSFIGTFERSRARKMLDLARAGITVRIWGNGWRKWLSKHPNLKIENQPLFNKNYIKALCASKINLCFLRKANQDRQTSRSMEIPACGAFMLAERTEEHQMLFEEGKEAEFFDIDDSEELCRKVFYYLENEEERKAITKAARERCLKSGYSYHELLLQLLQQVMSDTQPRILDNNCTKLV
jgi:hypothetical protein